MWMVPLTGLQSDISVLQTPAPHRYHSAIEVREIPSREGLVLLAVPSLDKLIPIHSKPLDDGSGRF
jgi:hypothetical protein